MPSKESEKEESIADQLVDMADEIMGSTKAMIDARGIYEQAAEMDTTHLIANYKTGEFYLKTNEREKASKFLLRVHQINPDFRFDLLYMIVQAYQYGYDFHLAKEFYSKYLKRLDWDKNYKGDDLVPRNEVERKLKQCEQALSYAESPFQYKIHAIGSEINSEGHDFAPVFNADETIMVFTSRRREGNLNQDVFEDNFPYEDIFIAHKKDGKWQEAQNIGENVNTKFHDSNLALSADGKKLFLYRDRNGGDIYVSEQGEDGEWGKPVELEGKVNSSYSENSISISPDGNVLFFSSNRPEGLGGFDIYKAVKNKKGNWANIENLGENINTKYDEDSPFINYDGKSLYFSSKGHGGAGGYDIFRTEYDEATNEWSTPVNLGFPVNTPDNDIFFVSTNNGKKAYYSSVRPQGVGYTDIYMLDLPDNDSQENIAEKEVASSNENTTPDPAYLDITLNMVVKNSATEEVISGATVELEHKESGKKETNHSTNNAKYQFALSQNKAETYKVSVQHEGFLYHNSLVSVVPSGEGTEVQKVLYMDPIKVGSVVILRNVYFRYNSDRILQESFEELDKLLEFLNKNQNVSIEVGGHSDNVGSTAMNLKMSEYRANALVKYLIAKGIPSSRLSYKGYGDTQPIASNDDEKDGRELNRRVEFKVVGLGE